jgi:elongation factor Ts
MDQIKELREQTGAGIMDCRNALEQSDGDIEKALEYLREKGLSKVAKKSDRETSEGMIELYSHGEGRVGVMVEVNCETDFVARNDDFRHLAHELALQIAASMPEWPTEEDVPAELLEAEREEARAQAKEEGKPDNVMDKIVEGRVNKILDEKVLMRQVYIRDGEKTVQDVVNAVIAKLGENISVRRFERWELGEHSEDAGDE